MKLIHNLISLSVLFSWVVINPPLVHSQSGNMSDITGPNPVEIPNNPDPVAEEGTPDPIAEEDTPDPIAEEDTPDPIAEEGTPTSDPSSEPIAEDTQNSEPPPENIPPTPTNPEIPSPSDPIGETAGNMAPSSDPIGEPADTTPDPVAVENSSVSDIDSTPGNETAQPILEQEETSLTNISETETEVDTVDTNGELTPENQTEVLETDTTATGEAEIEAPATDKTIAEESETTVVEESETTVVEESETTEIETTEKESVAVEEEPTETETADTAETEDTEKTEKTEKIAEEPDVKQKIDTQAYEVQIQQSSTELAVVMQEESYATQIASYSEIQIYGEAPSVEQISERLGELWKQTGKKAAFINVSLQKNQLESFTVLPSASPLLTDNSGTPQRLGGNEIASTNISKNQLVQPQELTLRNTVKNTSRKTLLATAKQFRQEISNPRKVRQNNYLVSAQELYQLIIAPIEAELEANDIDILVFAMDSGLRLLPLAALHDGEQFLIEKYAVAIVPSFGLTDTRYVNLSQSPILAMGASKFKEEQASLPTMPIELQSITHNSSRGEIYLNEDFTVANFKAQNRRSKPFSIIHLGTHAKFKPGSFNDSYIQFYDEKLQLSALREISDELGWSSSQNPPVDLLVLSACETALGDEEAELGFAGLALQAGVKSALASLWYVSDLGTLALMGEFYDRLDDTLIKAEALRQTQLRMLTGEVMVEDGHIKLSNGEHLSLPADFPRGNFRFSHPYFWSSFTLIGNWN